MAFGAIGLIVDQSLLVESFVRLIVNVLRMKSVGIYQEHVITLG